MRPFGIPLWAVVLVLCIVLPYVIRAWVEAERRRTHARTVALMRQLDPSWKPESNGPPRAGMSLTESDVTASTASEVSAASERESN